MRVVVTEAFRAYLNLQPEDFAEGQEVKGSAARYLLEAGAAVEPADDEAREIAGAPVSVPEPSHREPCVDGSVCGGGQCPPEQEPDGGSPEPSGELDIESSVAKILQWVGEDLDRADKALAAEQAKDKPRSTLVKQLEALLESSAN
ncbi:hypothetical protein [Streptomyces vilmorinianum]|uniref:hypothetical protein n=1 Tax=Streptomyces vilmorinianum TaxID=3051092 RepID=UPI0010FAE6C3|nr:hypothetical protein [Streptomyces vilmorinianum]